MLQRAYTYENIRVGRDAFPSRGDDSNVGAGDFRPWLRRHRQRPRSCPPLIHHHYEHNKMLVVQNCKQNEHYYHHHRHQQQQPITYTGCVGENRPPSVECRPWKWLFQGSNHGKPMAIGTAQRIYHDAKKKAGIKQGRGIHTLRHCAVYPAVFAGRLIYCGCLQTSW